MEKLVEKLRKIELVIDKNELLAETAGKLRQEHSLKQPEQLQQDFQAIAQEGRLLKVGIIGRVKAGKSSLLNALFFDGRSVLPKAATPMTAALSILAYDRQPGLEVDFYSEEDQLQIKKTAMLYEEALLKKKQEILAELEARAKKKKAEPEELQQKAEKRARSELDESMQEQKAAFEQYRMMQRAEMPSKRGRETYNDREGLRQRLKELVSADGAAMPFTKSVTLYLNEERLQDVELIDTPGTNDPVVSREQRTRDLLATCDVVFVVCPGGPVSECRRYGSDQPGPGKRWSAGIVSGGQPSG